jgi:rhodanese-related sulfurtransferase
MVEKGRHGYRCAQRSRVSGKASAGDDKRPPRPIARVAPNKEQPLLLHCLSGTRSAAGEDTLKRMGYQNVLNLGSYGRAQKILSE